MGTTTVFMNAVDIELNDFSAGIQVIQHTGGTVMCTAIAKLQHENSAVANVAIDVCVEEIRRSDSCLAGISHGADAQETTLRSFA